MRSNILFTAISLLVGAQCAAALATVNVQGFKNEACTGSPFDLALLDDPLPGNCEDFITGLNGITLEGGDAGCTLNLYSETQCVGLLSTVPIDSTTFGTCFTFPGEGTFSVELVGC